MTGVSDLGGAIEKVADALDSRNDGARDTAKEHGEMFKASIDTVKVGLKSLASSVKDTAEEKVPLAMFPGDQVIAAIVSLLLLLSFSMSLILWSSSVSCAMTLQTDPSDATAAFINTFCSAKHSHDGKFVFYLFLQSLLLSLPSLTFYQLWGAALSRHVSQLVSTRGAMIADVDSKILDDATPILNREFEDVVDACIEQTERTPYDPSRPHVRRQDSTQLDYAALIDAQLKQAVQADAMASMRRAPPASESRHVFKQAAAVIGLHVSAENRRSRWANAFLFSLLAQAAVAGLCIGVWWDTFKHDRFHWKDSVPDEDSSGGSFLCEIHLSLVQFAAASDNSTSDNSTSDNSTLVGLACVDPARYIGPWFVSFSLVLVCVMLALSLGRLWLQLFWYEHGGQARRWCACLRWPPQLPDDHDLLFQACEHTAPDLMRVKSFVAYKKMMEDIAKERHETLRAAEEATEVTQTTVRERAPQLIRTRALGQLFFRLLDQCDFGKRPDESPDKGKGMYDTRLFRKASEKRQAELLHLESIAIRMHKKFQQDEKLKDKPIPAPLSGMPYSPFDESVLIKYLCAAEKVDLPLVLLEWLGATTDQAEREVQQCIEAWQQYAKLEMWSNQRAAQELASLQAERQAVIDAMFDLAFFLHSEKSYSKLAQIMKGRS